MPLERPCSRRLVECFNKIPKNFRRRGYFSKIKALMNHEIHPEVFVLFCEESTMEPEVLSILGSKENISIVMPERLLWFVV